MCMSKYNSTLAVLRRNKRAITVNEGSKYQQIMCKYSQLSEALPQSFVDEFDLSEQAELGIEECGSHNEIKMHTDAVGGRRSNLLINVGTSVATVYHSNNDVLETVNIKPDEHFLLNTKKQHGCNNTTDLDWTFLTINWRKHYNELQHRF